MYDEKLKKIAQELEKNVIELVSAQGKENSIFILNQLINEIRRNNTK